MLEFIRPDWPAPARVQALTTTRSGGVSVAPFDSFNLAAHVGDEASRVEQNRSLLLRQADLPAQPSWINQTHGRQAVILEDDDCRDADAAITREEGRVAVVMTADCLPILLTNLAGDEVAAIHAGWRGLQAGVIQSTLAGMRSSGDQLLAWIGPGITQPSFEVGDEVREAFLQSTVDADACFKGHGEGHWLCDLPGLAELTLRQQSIGAVSRDPHCSFGDEELFYSYRRDGQSGRMASLIWIKSQP